VIDIHTFTLVLREKDLTEEQLESLGNECRDWVQVIREGIVTLVFKRIAMSSGKAVESARRDVAKAGLTVIADDKRK